MDGMPVCTRPSGWPAVLIFLALAVGAWLLR
jgi:hypothetical protein